MSSLYEHAEDDELKESVREGLGKLTLVLRCRSSEESLNDAVQALQALDDDEGEQNNEAYHDFPNKEAIRELLTDRRCSILNYLLENGPADAEVIAKATGIDSEVVKQELDTLYRHQLVEFERDHDSPRAFFPFRAVRLEPDLDRPLRTI